jgi:hypothetical protein
MPTPLMAMIKPKDKPEPAMETGRRNSFVESMHKISRLRSPKQANRLGESGWQTRIVALKRSGHYAMGIGWVEKWAFQNGFPGRITSPRGTIRFTTGASALKSSGGGPATASAIARSPTRRAIQLISWQDRVIGPLRVCGSTFTLRIEPLPRKVQYDTIGNEHAPSAG